MADEQKQTGSPIASGLIWGAQVAGALAVGWLLSKTGFYDAFFDAFGASFIFILAAAALYIFALPFLKHLPPMPRLLPERVTHLLFRALVLGCWALNIGSMFSQGAVTPVTITVFILAAIVAFIWSRRAEQDEDAEQAS
ncbi:MAG TPA: hypothetical protein PKY87_01925 [Terricaulis sp.]|nr:hypothetical protein [Terricaulis sp.]